jgi:hypothetical protein
MIRKFLLLSATVAAFSARAADGVSLELGYGDEDSHLVRAGLQWTWGEKRPLGKHLQWGGYWEASLGRWENGERVTDLAITPVLRLEHPGGGALAYVEGGIGLHLESQIEFSDHRTSGTRFQFGDHVGFGVRFGERLRHDLGLRLQHISNGGVASPNPGMNFAILRYQYHYD